MVVIIAVSWSLLHFLYSTQAIEEALDEAKQTVHSSLEDDYSLLEGDGLMMQEILPVWR